MELRPYQQEALDRLRQYVGRGGRRVMVQSATGSGKTVLASSIVKSALAKNRRILFTVPSLSLIDQTVEMFMRAGIEDIGVIQSNHPLTRISRPVQVASVQSLMRRDLVIHDVVLIDEAHRVFSFYKKWMAGPEWQDVPFIGLSATPWTKGLGKLYDELIVVATTGDLIKQGYLTPFKVFAPSHPDLSNVATVAGDYHEGQLSQVMSDADLVSDVVDTWRRLGEDRPTIVFAVDRAHAQLLANQFESVGIAAEYADYLTSLEERHAIRDRLHSGHTKVVCNCEVLTTGVDWDVRCIVLARPTKSEMLYVQMVGRGLRTAPEKQDLLILDHSNTTERMGFVTDIHYDHLDTGRPKAKSERSVEALPKICSQCSFLKPPRTATCPNCGHTATVKSQIRNLAGELVEVDEVKMKRRRAKDTLAALAPGGYLQGMLQSVADRRGYKPGWVQNQYREITGRWPKAQRVEAHPPIPEVLSWLKSQQIRFAKQQEKQNAHTGAP